MSSPRCRPLSWRPSGTRPVPGPGLTNGEMREGCRHADRKLGRSGTRWTKSIWLCISTVGRVVGGCRRRPARPPPNDIIYSARRRNVRHTRHGGGRAVEMNVTSLRLLMELASELSYPPMRPAPRDRRYVVKQRNYRDRGTRTSAVERRGGPTTTINFRVRHNFGSRVWRRGDIRSTLATRSSFIAGRRRRVVVVGGNAGRK